jgi:hypothetical protein
MPRKRFRLDARQREQLRDAIKAGERPVEIAKRFDVSRRTVYDYKKRLEEAAFYSRSKVLTVRLHPNDLDALDALAGRLGRSRADIARSVLLRAVDVFEPDPIESGEISALTKQLIPIGQNLNQLVRALNTANARNGVVIKPEAEAVLLEVGREVEEMAQTARRLLLRRAQIQRTRNAEIFEALGAPEEPAEAPDAPQGQQEALGAPERPTEAPDAPQGQQEALGAPERPVQASTPRRGRLAALLGL